MTKVDTKDAKKTEEIEEIELDAKALEAITDKTKEALLPEVQEMLEKSAGDTKKLIEDFVAKMDKPATKPVKKGEGEEEEEEDAEDPVAKGLKEGKFTEEVTKMSPAMRFYAGMRALENEDQSTLTALNAYAKASQAKARAELSKKGDQEAIAKTGYANETTAADGQVLIPDAEFVTTVFENLPNYGVAFREADVRQTDRTSVRVISLDSGLRFYATAEAGVKTSAKLAFSKNEVSLGKYAVIVPATDELTEDAAIDYWNVVTRELSRAYARIVDEAVFTHATTGITNLSGVITEPTSGAGTTITWDDLLSAEGKTEDDLDTSNHKWYMRKETWFRLLQLKGSTNDHYLTGSLVSGWVGNPNSPTTPWGTPVVFTRVLPTSGGTTTSDSSVVGSNDAFAVYGDLRNVIVYNKRGMQLKMLTEATVIDSEGSSLNLATQDASAMRAVVRFLVIVPKGNRSKFVIVGTGTVS